MHVIFEKDTGKILGISPKKQEENSIPVDLEQVKDILEGTDSKRNYRVEYNAKNKQLEFVDLHKESFDGASVNDFIYEIPEKEIDDADITVEQDVPNTCWRFTLGKTLKRNLRNKGIRLNNQLSFSITAKHDPNVLYKTISIDFSNVLSQNCVIVPFDSEFETERSLISVFTARKFDSYQFKRVWNDE